MDMKAENTQGRSTYHELRFGGLLKPCSGNSKKVIVAVAQNSGRGVIVSGKI